MSSFAKHALIQYYHTLACFLVFSVFVQSTPIESLILTLPHFCYSMHHLFQIYHSFVISYITWDLNGGSPLHIYLLLPFNQRKNINQRKSNVYLYTIAVFKQSRVCIVTKKLGGNLGKSDKIRELFLWSVDIYIFQTKLEFFKFHKFFESCTCVKS